MLGGSKLVDGGICSFELGKRYGRCHSGDGAGGLGKLSAACNAAVDQSGEYSPNAASTDAKILRASVKPSSATVFLS